MLGIDYTFAITLFPPTLSIVNHYFKTTINYALFDKIGMKIRVAQSYDPKYGLKILSPFALIPKRD